MTTEELIVRHRADAWDCHSRGMADLAQLHMIFARELETLAAHLWSQSHRWSNGLPVIKVRPRRDSCSELTETP